MSSTLRGPEQVEVSVAILTSAFQIRGKMPVLGTFLTFINDEQKPTLTLNNAVVLGVHATNPAAQMVQPEILVLKRAIQVLALESAPPSGIVLSPRSESLMLYTEQYAIMGRWHMSPDMRVQDFVEASTAQFLPVSNARIYALFQARQGIIPGTQLAFVHRSAAQSYHKA
ncbi:MAG: hypothetical protein CUN49_00530 [Candidatus Thermofonsia Clade 1 bacterium]|jgi:hypothetical protein|uniref:Uncharacterized protein n=1 Tax=Candidatus Thermofonsia Clade 1 bacterium TaxID=2364210 RepID=A0A2M8PIK3_9CHLR|nr:MAG: hypothetical protein CUN49_00530 [Candidatus Thermofonsia Clade 1 bacterium]RMF52949.1 MAG: hypothetical protein D6749_03535 [Chloroflexota bacterium]